jgi:hypothetical protein
MLLNVTEIKNTNTCRFSELALFCLSQFFHYFFCFVFLQLLVKNAPGLNFKIEPEVRFGKHDSQVVASLLTFEKNLFPNFERFLGILFILGSLKKIRNIFLILANVAFPKTEYGKSHGINFFQFSAIQHLIHSPLVIEILIIDHSKGNTVLFRVKLMFMFSLAVLNDERNALL